MKLTTEQLLDALKIAHATALMLAAQLRAIDDADDTYTLKGCVSGTHDALHIAHNMEQNILNRTGGQQP